MADRSPVPRFLVESNWADFFQGFSLPFWAVGVIFRSKKLLTLSLVAAAISVATVALMAVFLVQPFNDFVRFLIGRPRDWYGRIGYRIITLLAWVVLGVVAANTLPVLVLSPLQDPISEAAEEACGDFVPRSFSFFGFIRNSAIAFGHTAARVSFLFIGHLVLWSLHLLPLIGTILWTAVANIWTAGWLAAEYLDAPMARHQYPFTDVQGAIADRLRLCMGFGAAVYILLWIPVVNFFLVPLAIVGGTLLYRGLRASGTLGPPPVHS